jgi:CRISPR/Cas system-associated protein endoribonuclease Cas2
MFIYSLPKARQRIKINLRGFLTRDLYIMPQAFVTYIRIFSKITALQEAIV